MKKENLDILDVTKFILTFFIVAIHTNLFPMVLYPWLRLAIPLFFLISSYLLHEKMKNLLESERKRAVRKYIKRQLQLYGFWFIVLLPITVYVQSKWFVDGLGVGLVRAATHTIFSSTFIGAWYISATIIGTLLVEWLSRKMSKKVLFLTFMIPYIVCCLVSSYSFLFSGNQNLMDFANEYSFIMPAPFSTFLIALVYIYLGSLLVDNKKRCNKRIKAILLVILLIALYVEWRITSFYSGSISNVCLFMLLPCSYLIFELLLSTKITIKNSVKLRKISVMMYPLHASMAVVMKIIVGKIIDANPTVEALIVFCGTTIVSLVICFVILKLENKPILKLLKYAH